MLTAVFLYIILGATDDRAPKGFAPIAIGLGLTVIHLVGIPVTNLSVNPARSLGVAWFAGGAALAQVWLFIVAPIIGAAIAGISYAAITGANQKVDEGVANNPYVRDCALAPRLQERLVTSRMAEPHAIWLHCRDEGAGTRQTHCGALGREAARSPGLDRRHARPGSLEPGHDTAGLRFLCLRAAEASESTSLRHERRAGAGDRRSARLPATRSVADQQRARA